MKIEIEIEMETNEVKCHICNCNTYKYLYSKFNIIMYSACLQSERKLNRKNILCEWVLCDNYGNEFIKNTLKVKKEIEQGNISIKSLQLLAFNQLPSNDIKCINDRNMII